MDATHTVDQRFKDYISGTSNFSDSFSDLTQTTLEEKAQGKETIETFLEYTPVPIQNQKITLERPGLLRRIIHNIMTLFMTTVGTPAEENYISAFNAGTLLGIYCKYLAVPVFIAVQIASAAGWVYALGITVVVSALFCLALAVYVKFFKLPPQKIPCGIHLLSHKGENNVVSREEVQELDRCIQWMDKGKLPFSAALLAEPGEGKSSVIQAFATQHKDDYLVYSLRTPELIKSYEGMGDKLAYIKNVIGKQDKKVVLVFEEFDTAIIHSDNRNLLYSLLDDEGIACIPVMSAGSYHHNADDSFLRRFQPTYLKNEGEEFELWYKNVLLQVHRYCGSDVYVEDAVFEKIIEKSKNQKNVKKENKKYGAPAYGVNLLLRAIHWIRQGAPEGKFVVEKRKEALKKENARFSFLNGDDSVPKIKEPSTVIQQREEQYSRIRKISKLYAENQRRQEELAEKIRKAKSVPTTEDEREFILLRKVVHVKLREKLKKLVKEMPQDEDCYFPVSIDEKLIGKVEEQLKFVKV